MTRPVDERLFGAWIPDPGQPDAEQWASLVISPAGWLRFIVREPAGLRTVEHDYRVREGGRLDIQEADGRWTDQPYAVEAGPVLLVGSRQYVLAADPADRPWPPDAAGQPDAADQPEAADD